MQPSAAIAPVKVLEVGHGKVPGKPTVITAVALAAGGKLLASGGDDHLVRIWNTQTGELTQTLYGPCRLGAQLVVQPRPFAVGFRPATITSWSSGSWARAKPVQVLAERGAPIYSAVFSHDGRRIAAVGFEEDVTIYDVASGKVERKLNGPCRDLRCVVFAPGDERVAVVGRNGQIRIWSTADWKVVLEINADQQRDPQPGLFARRGQVGRGGGWAQIGLVGCPVGRIAASSDRQAGQDHVAGLLRRRAVGDRRQRQRRADLGSDQAGRTLEPVGS